MTPVPDPPGQWRVRTWLREFDKVVNRKLLRKWRDRLAQLGEAVSGEGAT